MIFILWTISFIKSLNCFSHNYTYQRGIPSLYVSLRDERANFLAVINTHNSFSLFEGSRDVFGTYSQKIIDRNKDFYLRGMREYQINNEKRYLIDTCLNSQDNYEKLVNYFLEE